MSHWIQGILKEIADGTKLILKLKTYLVGFQQVPGCHDGTHLASAFIYNTDHVRITTTLVMWANNLMLLGCITLLVKWPSPSSPHYWLQKLLTCTPCTNLILWCWFCNLHCFIPDNLIGEIEEHIQSLILPRWKSRTSRRVTGLLNTLSWSKHNGLWYNATNQPLNTFLSPVSELSHLCMWPWILWYELSISCSENRLGNNIFLHCKFSGQEYQHKLWRQHTKCFGLVVMMIEHWAVVVMIVFVVGASFGTIHCIAWVFSLLTHLELM